MSYSTLPTAVRETAENVLTRKQLTTYKLSANGLSQRDIADQLGITRWAVRDRLAEADRKIHLAMKEAA